MRLRPLLVTVVVVALAAGLLAQFIRSVRQTRAEPYTTRASARGGWQVSVSAGDTPTAPVLVARAPEGFAGGLFRQVFARGMESLGAPGEAGLPLLLREEFDRAFASHTTIDTLLAAAHLAVDGTSFEPHCMGVRRVSEPGLTRQVYFVVFTSPGFDTFRQHLTTLAAPPAVASATFEPGALSPVVIIAAAPPTFDTWFPLRVDREQDCVAPIRVQ